MAAWKVGPKVAKMADTKVVTMAVCSAVHWAEMMVAWMVVKMVGQKADYWAVWRAVLSVVWKAERMVGKTVACGADH